MTSREKQSGRCYSGPVAPFIPLAIAFVLFLGLVSVSVVHSYETKDPFHKYCLAKAEYARLVMRSRGPEEQAKEEIAERIASLEERYRQPGTTLPHHSHVDMQRIVRDAYRINGGKYRRNDPTVFAGRELNACLEQGF